MGEDLIIRNVTVIDGTGGAPVANAEVAIAGGLFAAIRPAGRESNGATVFDGGTLEEMIAGVGHGHLRSFAGIVGVLSLKPSRFSDDPVGLVAVLRCKLAVLAQHFFRRQ